MSNAPTVWNEEYQAKAVDLALATQTLRRREFGMDYQEKLLLADALMHVTERNVDLQAALNVISVPADVKRLKEEIKRLTERCAAYRGQVEAGAAQLAGMRAALEQMLVDPPATLDEPDTDAEVIVKLRAIARAALKASQ